MPALLHKWAPTGKGVTENIIANLVLSGVGLAVSFALTWIAAPATPREWVVWFLGCMLAVSAAFAMGALGWRRLHPQTPLNDGPILKEVTAGSALNSESADDEQDRLAKIVWRRGYRHSSVGEPWELAAKIAFTRHAREASCYVRWGRLVYFLGAPPAWEWSKQTVLLAPQTVHEGRVDDHIIATIPPKDPGNKRMVVFGDEIAGERNGENLICIELTVASLSAKPQVERGYYSLVESTERLVPVWINKSKLERARG